ncbi:MAG: UbiA family prenyltransferase [Thermomicrobiales bacterium]
MSTLRTHLSLARISNTPTVVSNALAGAALATSLAFGWPIVALCLASALFYTAGMYLNDILDVEIDRQQRPDRPLPSGAVSMPMAWGITGGMFIVGLALVATTNWHAAVAAVALIAAIAVYDAWHKGNPIGPLFMGGTRVLVYVMAFLAFSGRSAWTTEATLWCAVMLLYVAALTSIAKMERGPAGFRYWPVVSLFLPPVLAIFRDFSPGVIVLAGVMVGWAVYSLTFVYQQQPPAFGRAIASLIAGISLLDALLLATHGEWIAVGIALIAFVATNVLQRWIRGT